MFCTISFVSLNKRTSERAGFCLCRTHSLRALDSHSYNEVNWNRNNAEKEIHNVSKCLDDASKKHPPIRMNTTIDSSTAKWNKSFGNSSIVTMICVWLLWLLKNLETFSFHCKNWLQTVSLIRLVLWTNSFPSCPFICHLLVCRHSLLFCLWLKTATPNRCAICITIKLIRSSVCVFFFGGNFMMLLMPTVRNPSAGYEESTRDKSSLNVHKCRYQCGFTNRMNSPLLFGGRQ